MGKWQKCHPQPNIIQLKFFAPVLLKQEHKIYNCAWNKCYDEQTDDYSNSDGSFSISQKFASCKIVRQFSTILLLDDCKNFAITRGHDQYWYGNSGQSNRWPITFLVSENHPESVWEIRKPTRRARSAQWQHDIDFPLLSDYSGEDKVSQSVCPRWQHLDYEL